MDPRKIDRTCLLLAIVGIENQQKNSWRSLDCGGNGYLGVYEGGAGRVAQERGEGGEIRERRYTSSTGTDKGADPVEKGRGVDSAETVRKAPEEDAEKASLPHPHLSLSLSLS